MPAPSAPAAPAPSLRSELTAAYFAAVAGLSLAIFSVVLIGLGADIILRLWPALLDADIARAARWSALWPTDEPFRPPAFFYHPDNADLVEGILAALVLGLVFGFHGRSVFARARL